MSKTGLRERKKERTRALIAQTAFELFSARGFDNVTVAEIARAADVAEKTVFNYFPTKEDLVYGRMEFFEAELLQAIRERSPGESALAAFGRFVLEPRGRLASDRAADDIRAITTVITGSRDLLEREAQIFERYTSALAALLAEETGAREGDAEPWVVANVLMGVHRALIAYVRRRVLEGAENPTLRRDARAQGRRVLARLERGLGSYAVRGER
jgi:AcrR family transcriptional regulator